MSQKTLLFSIILMSFVHQFTVDGIGYSYGANMGVVAGQLKGNSSTAELASIGSVLNGVILFSSFTGSFTIPYFGYPKTVFLGGTLGIIGFALSNFCSDLYMMILLFGFVAGVGLGQLHSTGICMLTDKLTSHVATATGIARSGTSFGMVVFGLIPAFQGPQSFLYLCLLYVSLCLVCAIASPLILTALETKKKPVDVEKCENKSSNQEAQQSAEADKTESTSAFVARILVDKKFVWFLVYRLSMSMAVLIPFTFLEKTMTVERNLDPATSRYFISFIGIANFIGRATSGLLCEKLNLRPAVVIAVTCFCSTICVSLMSFATEMWQFYLLCSALGLLIAPCESFVSLIVQEFYGNDRLKLTFGITSILDGLFKIIGSPLAGQVENYTGYTSATYYFCAAWFLVAGVSAALTQYFNKPKQIEEVKQAEKPIELRLEDGILSEKDLSKSIIEASGNKDKSENLGSVAGSILGLYQRVESTESSELGDSEEEKEAKEKDTVGVKEDNAEKDTEAEKKRRQG